MIHTPEEFALRKNDYSDPHLGAWRAYYKALVEAGVYVGADALEVPETGTTVRLRDGKRRVQDGSYADTKEQLAGFIILELPSVDAALEWAIVFEIAKKGDKTEVRFKHMGLVPAYESYNNCSKAWGMLVNGNLRKLITTGKGQPDAFA